MIHIRWMSLLTVRSWTVSVWPEGSALKSPAVSAKWPRWLVPTCGSNPSSVHSLGKRHDASDVHQAGQLSQPLASHVGEIDDVDRQAREVELRHRGRADSVLEQRSRWRSPLPRMRTLDGRAITYAPRSARTRAVCTSQAGVGSGHDEGQPVLGRHAAFGRTTQSGDGSGDVFSRWRLGREDPNGLTATSTKHGDTRP